MRHITCEEAVRRLSSYLDRALSGETLQQLEEHLQVCLDCCDKLQFSRQLDTLVKGRIRDVQLPEGIEDRIRRRLALLEEKGA